jgi:TonB family protein
MLIRMRTFVPLVLFVLCVPSFAQDAPPQDEIVRGLKNLETLAGAIQAVGTLQLRGMPMPPPPTCDPWGTPYRFEVTGSGYRMVGAGSDRQFEASWGVSQQFTGLEGDAVIQDGRIVRTNRIWLHRYVTAGSASEEAERSLDGVEAEVAAMRHRVLLDLGATKWTLRAMPHVAAGRRTPGPVDLWGTPYRINVDAHKVRVVSAGSDRKFDPASWSQPPRPDPAEDLIYENGRFTRTIDPEAVFRSAEKDGWPDWLPQPVEERNTAAGERGVDGEVKAPVVVARVEPKYSEAARKGRIGGVVMVEMIFTKDGKVEDVRLLRSVLSSLDLAVMDAVRQWKFQPATIDGQPVSVVFNLTLRFSPTQ